MADAQVDIGNFTEATCDDDETWCFSLHSAQVNKPLEWKRCWNPGWDHGQYSEDGCIIGQHCIMGTCYENATVCLCQGDDCNGWLPGDNNTISTPIPYPPTTPSGAVLNITNF